jgi:hypothetical protein
MKHAAHILLVGNDGRLLNERAALLSNFWSVSAISTFDKADALVRSSDLLVLCHTVTEEQRLHWIAASREVAPARPIVSLEFAEIARRVGVDAVVDHHRGPAALVSTIYEILVERGLGSKLWVGGGHTLLAPNGSPETSTGA